MDAETAKFLRVLSALRGFIFNVTAECAETRKGFGYELSYLRFSSIILRVLSALCGLFLMNHRARGDRKGFGKDFHTNAIPQSPLRS